jgi:integrin beta 1
MNFSGQCQCTPRDNPEETFSGPLCECDNFSCDRKDGKLCSGNGRCECQNCRCNEGWGGSACECSTSTDECTDADGKICSGHGDCVCGRCECREDENGRHSGKLCEKCPTCPNRCAELKDCVECMQYKKGPLMANNECNKNCTHLMRTPLAVDTVTRKLTVNFLRKLNDLT